MELGNLVAHYATKGEKGVEINLEALSQDKHFRSQAVQAVVKKVKEKHLDGPVMGTKTMKIKGMTCEHCVNNVTNAINKVAGASAKVSLKDKEAIISYDRELSNIELRKAVEDAGYEVISLS